MADFSELVHQLPTMTKMELFNLKVATIATHLKTLRVLQSPAQWALGVVT